MNFFDFKPEGTPDSGDFDRAAPVIVSSNIKVRYVFFIAATFLFLGMLLTVILTKLLETGAGWDMDVLAGKLAENAPQSDVWKVRLVAGLNQLLVFLVPALATIMVFRRASPEIKAGVSLKRFPDMMTIALSLGLLIASMPFVFYVFQINKLIPVPEAMQVVAEQATKTIKALMRMPTIWDFVANLLLIAVLPALGEELLFRGLIQRQLMRRMSPWVAIIVTGALFSFFHFQVDGFLPRWLLGILLGWVFWQTGNFWVPVLLHFINNGVQVFGQYLYGQGMSSVDIEQDVQIPVLVAVLSLAATWMIGRQLVQWIKAG